MSLPVAGNWFALERQLALPVTVVHGGHEPSFGRGRLLAVARYYLDHWPS
ncbi:MAG: hypothetical protein HXY22_12275 [Alphaproteobacteria bacterium]|nr:hypothetical protein [Alphaproteobacteria bacterium]